MYFKKGNTETTPTEETDAASKKKSKKKKKKSETASENDDSELANTLNDIKENGADDVFENSQDEEGTEI